MSIVLHSVHLMSWNTIAFRIFAVAELAKSFGGHGQSPKVFATSATTCIGTYLSPTTPAGKKPHEA